MSFEFYCPQGHLLEGDDSQLGTEGRCPLCGTLFIFPKTTLIARREKLQREAQSPTSGFISDDIPQPMVGPELVEPERRVLKVFCPNGHVLNTPEELLGSEAVCLKCKVRFTPTVERSVTYLRNKTRYEAMKNETQGRFWLGVAVLAVTVAATVAVVLYFYFRKLNG